MKHFSILSLISLCSLLLLAPACGWKRGNKGRCCQTIPYSGAVYNQAPCIQPEPGCFATGEYGAPIESGVYQDPTNAQYQGMPEDIRNNQIEQGQMSNNMYDQNIDVGQGYANQDLENIDEEFGEDEYPSRQLEESPKSNGKPASLQHQIDDEDEDLEELEEEKANNK